MSDEWRLAPSVYLVMGDLIYRGPTDEDCAAASVHWQLMEEERSSSFIAAVDYLIDRYPHKVSECIEWATAFEDLGLDPEQEVIEHIQRMSKGESIEGRDTHP